ncbi:hypothetical protein SUGI_0589580 [Cryptomeria japonica]|uniref:ethylene-responsive transcription factor ERF024 n=1 Tax=Cryptomeria japonica TaxID=3369 RepID=UPI002414BCA6|nr:ethylene-responsive transcription factor ERF024 [Cryptomeria japonica]GLJ29841.1 hypothetical protein SUGI_0589580 [Cryptomeria japonica]
MSREDKRKREAAESSEEEEKVAYGGGGSGEESDDSGGGRGGEAAEKRQKIEGQVGGNKHPLYRGVRMRTWGKWVSEIREPKKKNRIWLGTFPTPEMAARAHDVAALSIKGKNAFLNFPHLADSLPRPATLLPRDIQAAATAAANDFCLESAETAPPEAKEEAAQSAESGEYSGDFSSGFDWLARFLVENEPSIIDDDILFDMPNFLANMAEGLLVAPPWLQSDYNMSESICTETSLWSYT